MVSETTVETPAMHRLQAWMARDRENRTQIAVASALGVSQAAVSWWVQGYARPDPARRVQLAQLTEGEVSASDWATEAETRPERVKPMRGAK